MNADPLAAQFLKNLRDLENGPDAHADKASRPLDPLDDGVPDETVVMEYGGIGGVKTAATLRHEISRERPDDIRGRLGFAELDAGKTGREADIARLRIRIYLAELARRA